MFRCFLTTSRLREERNKKNMLAAFVHRHLSLFLLLLPLSLSYRYDGLAARRMAARADIGRESARVCAGVVGFGIFRSNACFVVVGGVFAGRVEHKVRGALQLRRKKKHFFLPRSSPRAVRQLLLPPTPKKLGARAVSPPLFSLDPLSPPCLVPHSAELRDLSCTAREPPRIGDELQLQLRSFSKKKKTRNGADDDLQRPRRRPRPFEARRRAASRCDP